MKIGIDCRLFGPKDTGIGRYVQNLVKELLLINPKIEFVLFVRRSFFQENFHLDLSKLSSNIKFVNADLPHYSWKEQLFFPKIIAKEKVDLMHFTHFNVPIFYRGLFVVTIHDLIKHFFSGPSTTTRSYLLYWLKRLGYFLVFRKAVFKSRLIFAPSNFVKQQLIEQYNLPSSKVEVTYEGVNQFLNKVGQKTSNKVLEKYQVKKPYILYVGNIYPHKNLDNLLTAIGILNKKNRFTVELVVICARNVFSQRLSKKVAQKGLKNFVKITGYVSDKDLFLFYRNASCFVFPTLSEGFGLPGLEAMSLSCPVVCSNIPVLKEIYQEGALYFDPKNPNDIAQKIKEVVTKKELSKILVKNGKEVVKKYSWRKTANQTLNSYFKVLKNENSFSL